MDLSYDRLRDNDDDDDDDNDDVIYARHHKV